MRPPALQKLLVLAACLCAAAPAAAQEVILLDGIAATVNGEVISIGEARRAALLAREQKLGVGSLCLGQPLPAATLATGEVPAALANPAISGPPTAEEIAAAVECLIDTRLVFREVRRFPRTGIREAEIDAMLERLRGEFGEEAFAAEMTRLDLTVAEIRADLRRQLLVADYIDTRFRTTVDITEEQAREAWDDDFVPDMRARGVAVPDFAEVREDYVVPILREREVNRRVQSWIRDLRDRSEIRRMYP